MPASSPPLPRGDRVSRLAWAGVLGAPVFLVLAVALGWRLPSWVTVLAVGALVGGFAGRLIGLYREGDPLGFIMAVVGAIVVLAVYRYTFGRPATV